MGSGRRGVSDNLGLKTLPMPIRCANNDDRFSGIERKASGKLHEGARGGPVGKIQDGDLIRVIVDTLKLEGAIDLVRQDGAEGSYTPDDAELGRRSYRSDLAADPSLPADTRLWAALQNASGGPWKGSVYDVEQTSGD